VKKVYRGLGLETKFLQKYVENRGSGVLLNGFYVNVDGKEGGFEIRKRRTPTLFEINVVDYNSFFRRLHHQLRVSRGKWGLLPVKIDSYSRFPSEKEVLFPPFYQ